MFPCIRNSSFIFRLPLSFINYLQVVLDDLSRAREGFILASDLNLLYLVTPINVEVEPDWKRFMELSALDHIKILLGKSENFYELMAGATMERDVLDSVAKIVFSILELFCNVFWTKMQTLCSERFSSHFEVYVRLCICSQTIIYALFMFGNLYDCIEIIL